MSRRSNTAEVLWDSPLPKQPLRKAVLKKSPPDGTLPNVEAEIAFIEPPAPDDIGIPEQKEYFQLPVRFGAVPVDEAPLGWEVETRRRETKVTKFQHTYPTIRLPFQEVQRIEFGHNEKFLAENQKNRKQRELFPTGANRLFFGDNIHVMRQLPNESIDLIYIDPPFFSGRNYNVIFGDKNEIRSFSDIWEGGMPGYLVWLNARLWEMKRLLKPTGSIYVHLDWHASHYVKVEMDKIFGSDHFINEIAWCYSGGGRGKSSYAKKHDILLFYSKNSNYYFDIERVRVPHSPNSGWANVGGEIKGGKRYDALAEGKIPEDWWQIPQVNHTSREYIGYQIQKPIELMQRLIESSCPENGVIADFFCGGGSFLVAAAGMRVRREFRLVSNGNGRCVEKTKFDYEFSGIPRRWIGCDQSRIAIAITKDRLAKVVREKVGTLFPVPDFTVEHWGIYEAPKLENYSLEKFRQFVVEAFGGKPENVSPAIHGVKHGDPLYVGEPSRRSAINKEDVDRFFKALLKDRRAHKGYMLAWNFLPEARRAAEILAARENKRIDFVRLSLIRLESDEFRQHVIKKHESYGSLLCFILPPEIHLNWHRIKPLTYQFDVSETMIFNKDAEIANVQWDFDHQLGKFSSTPGYTFLREKDKPVLIVEYKFPKAGEYTIAYSVQDNQGGEATVVKTIKVN